MTTAPPIPSDRTEIRRGSAVTRPSELIVVHDGLETPTPGRWSIPPQTLAVRTGGWPRSWTSSTVHGALVVGDETTLELETVADAGVPDDAARFRFRGRLVARDHLGRWRFDGHASSAAAVHEMAVRVTYDGVFRTGAHGLTRLVVTGAALARRSRRHPRSRRHLVHDLHGGLNALLECTSRRAQPVR